MNVSSQPEPDDIKARAIEADLRSLLPQQPLNQRLAFARVLADVEAQRITEAEAVQQLTKDPQLRLMLRNLAGQTIAPQGTPISISFGADSQFGDITIGDVVAGDKISLTIDLGDSRGRRDEEQRLRKRQKILALVRLLWIERLLDNTLAEVLWIDLGFSEQPEAVNIPLNTFVQGTGGSARAIAPGTKTLNIFDEFEESLLILGEPGAGKTTLLLDLARDLLRRAETDSSYPMPMVFNLASWSLKRKPLEEWLVDELQKNYSVPPSDSRPLLEQNAILPLLDGLDEVAAEARNACAEAINRFKASHMVSLVVCSRRKDYQALPTRLALQGAVLVQPIEQQQMDVYLAQYGERLTQLRFALREDPELCELAETPLMLSLMAVVYKEGEQQAIAEEQAKEEKQRVLFNQYIDTMFQRRGKTLHDKEHTIGWLTWLAQRLQRRGETLYDKEHTIGWLTWLAQRLQQHEQTLFLIEQIQPTWLPNKASIWVYTLISRVLSVFLLTTILGLGLFAANIWELACIGILGGGIVGIIDGVRLTLLGKNPPSSTGYAVLRILGIWFVIALALGPFFGLVKQGPAQDMIFGGTFAVTGFNLGVFAAAFIGVIFGLRGSRQRLQDDVLTVEKLAWSTRDALKGAVNYGIGFACVGCAVATPVWLSGGRGSEWATKASVALFAWLTTPLGITNPLVNILLMATVMAGGFGVLFGTVIQGLQYSIIDADKKVKVNQGIRLAVRNAVQAVGVFSLAFGLCFFVLIFAANEFSTRNLFEIILSSLRIGLVVGTIAALWNGGFDILQHYTLRTLLFAQGFIPSGSYVRFLEYATARIFLRRPGGGYIFLHRTLMEHFARHKAQYAVALPNKWRRLWLQIALSLGILFGALTLFTYGYGPAVLLAHERVQPAVAFRTVQVGENIIHPEGILCNDICVQQGDSVLVQAGGRMHTGHFVIWVTPNGTNSGFLGAPMGRTWDIPNIPAGTLHGALMCRIHGEQEWRRCGSRLEFQAPISGCLEFMINGIEFQKYAGYYYVSVQTRSD